MAVEVGQPRANTVVVGSEEMIEATGGNVVVPSPYLEYEEGLLAGPGNQNVREEAD